MSRAPVCSVVIPAYLCGEYIADCLNSVRRQTISDIEIIVVDDCSPDGTRDIVNSLAAADGRIRCLVQHHNSGAAAARNRGVLEAAGEWIAFADSDDIWESDKLERQLALQRSTGAGLIYTGAQCMDSSGRLTGRRLRVPDTLDYGRLLRGSDIICSSVLVRRELMLLHPMERSDLHEDYLCWLRLLKSGCTAAGIDEPLLRYRLSRSSKSSNKLRSARMTWRTLGVMRIPFIKRCGCFACYVLHGVRRYLV